MRKLSLLSILVAFALFVSCGEKAEEFKQVMEAIENAPEIVEQMEESVNRAEEIREERAERGDTLAMNFRELIKFLPTEVSGYEASKPKGESINMGGMSFSNAEIKYTKKAEDGTESVIRLSLIDYNSAFIMYQGVTALWAAGFSVDNSEMTQKGYDPGIEDAMGFETFYYEKNKAEIQMGVGYRFFIDASATNVESVDILKDIVMELPIEKLAKM
jgi:hypothetical protein